MVRQNEIPVFFSVNDNYVPYLAAALRSAIENASASRSYRAIILHQDISAEHQALLRSMQKKHFAVELISMADCKDITDRKENRLRCDYFTMTIYYRLFIPAMFPQYDRGIYIDSDVIVLGDLAELYDTDIGDNLIGACRDSSIQEIPELVRYVEEAVGIPRQQYINSGVLLMNLAQLRRVQMDKVFLRLLNTYHFESIAPDQDYINAMCHGRIYYLDESWDAMPNENHPEQAHPNLIHYNLFCKPWCCAGTQYESHFWHYIADTPFAAAVRAHLEHYSPAQKKADAQCLKHLVAEGNRIPDNDVTFRKVVQNGGVIRL